MSIIDTLIQIIGIIFLIFVFLLLALMLIGIYKLGNEPVEITYDIEIRGDSEIENEDKKVD